MGQPCHYPYNETVAINTGSDQHQDVGGSSSITRHYSRNSTACRQSATRELASLSVLTTVKHPGVIGPVWPGPANGPLSCVYRITWTIHQIWQAYKARI